MFIHWFQAEAGHEDYNILVAAECIEKTHSERTASRKRKIVSIAEP